MNRLNAWLNWLSNKRYWLIGVWVILWVMPTVIVFGVLPKVGYSYFAQTMTVPNLRNLFYLPEVLYLSEPKPTPIAATVTTPAPEIEPAYLISGTNKELDHWLFERIKATPIIGQAIVIYIQAGKAVCGLTLFSLLVAFLKGK